MVFVTVTNTSYSKWIGLKKALKNVVIINLLPGVLLMLNSYKDWVPNEYLAYASPFIMIGAYFIKNFLENR